MFGYDVNPSNPFPSLWEDPIEEPIEETIEETVEETKETKEPEKFSVGSVSKILQDKEIDVTNKKTLMSLGGVILIGIVGYLLLKK